MDGHRAEHQRREFELLGCAEGDASPLVHAGERCAQGELKGAAGAKEAAKLRQFRCSLAATVCGAAAVALVAGPLVWLGCGLCIVPGQRLAVHVVRSELTQLVAVPECEDFFARGGACKTKNAWECVGDDGSQEFRCCCTDGYGDFSKITGMISVNMQPGSCVDLTSALVGSGIPFYEGIAVLGDCAAGNPNKQFHMPVSGVGQIKWATHPTKCLGVKDGATFNGNKLTLQDCEAGNAAWMQFNMLAGGPEQSSAHRIKWATHPDKCLNVAEEKIDNRNMIQLFDCNEAWSSQLFTVSQPAPQATVPSLFCIALMLPYGYELSMLEAQLLKGVGLFACDDSAIYSNESIRLPGPKTVSTVVLPGSLEVQFGGEWHSALNTDIFIRVWEKVITDPRVDSHAWTVKVDPDTVFLPDRLRDILWHQYAPAGDTGAPVFLNNCFLGMHGPIEVLSRQAVAVYRAKKEVCRSGAPYTHKQEDFYFRECWQLIGISMLDVFNILLEHEYACNERPTTRDGRHPCFAHQVAFHPFKSVDAYFQCHQRASSQKWVAPLTAYGVPPSHANFHHS